MNGMNAFGNGSAEWHREQRGIKTPEQVRIEQLEAELVSLALEKQMRQMAEQSNVKLLAELAECKRDAERWREYQARKVRLTEAGFGKSPLRDSAIAAQKGEGK